MIIGICGKSGSGKTTLANEILKYKKNKNVTHIDIDKIGHIVLKINEVKGLLIKKFGKEIVKDNIVDRKLLAKKTFNSEEEMDKLIECTWPAMQNILNKKIQEEKENLIILDWQLLQKTEYFNMCNITILLDIPFEIRKNRVIKRDNIKSEQFDLREKASYKYKKDLFTIILNNNDEIEIRKVVEQICQ